MSLDLGLTFLSAKSDVECECVSECLRCGDDFSTLLLADEDVFLMLVNVLDCLEEDDEGLWLVLSSTFDFEVEDDLIVRLTATVLNCTGATLGTEGGSGLCSVTRAIC